MADIAKVSFGADEELEDFTFTDISIVPGDIVIARRGDFTDNGIVNSIITHQKTFSANALLKKATKEDLERIKQNKEKAKNVMDICERKIREYGLNMKIVGVEYSFDRHLIMIYFCAEGRVDFRQLVKDLAQIFRSRLQLKQIGVRNGAKILSGLGICGRRLCCSSFLHKFAPVTMKMAKEQHLQLNPSYLSGSCNRLKCCIAYEYQVYKDFAKKLPKIGDTLKIGDEKGKVVSIDVLRQLVTIQTPEGTQKIIDYSKGSGKQLSD